MVRKVEFSNTSLIIRIVIEIYEITEQLMNKKLKIKLNLEND